MKSVRSGTTAHASNDLLASVDDEELEVAVKLTVAIVKAIATRGS